MPRAMETGPPRREVAAPDGKAAAEPWHGGAAREPLTVACLARDRGRRQSGPGGAVVQRKCGRRPPAPVQETTKGAPTRRPSLTTLTGSAARAWR